MKGIRTVIEAWRILDKNAPELLVAGNGPLADWAKAQKLPKVRFLGQLPRDELAPASSARAALWWVPLVL